ncbi:MAG: RNA polymerase sigma-70 factor [Bacteroidota bacterium]
MITRSLHNERDLLLQVAKGDEQAFTALYQGYQDGLNKFILSYIKSREIAEDLQQEVFLKIWERRSYLPELASFRNYLFIIARNHTLDVLRSAARLSAAKGNFYKNYAVLHSNNTYDSLLLKGYSEYIQKMLSSLSPKTREVFLLCRQENKSHKEIADLLGITQDAVKRHMITANKAFKDSVDKQFGISLSLVALLMGHS